MTILKALASTLLASAMMIGRVLAGDVTIAVSGAPALYSKDKRGDLVVGGWSVTDDLIGLGEETRAINLALTYGSGLLGFTVYCSAGGHYFYDIIPPAVVVPNEPTTINVVVNGHRQAVAGKAMFEYDVESVDLSKAGLAFLISSGPDAAAAFALAVKVCGSPAS
jgi:hypothetical protein